MSAARKLLIGGGLALAVLGMGYGLHYALFMQHQALARMDGLLNGAFVDAARRDTSAAHSAIDAYAAVKYDYIRQVDAHSHWIGLAMLLIVLGAAFDRVTLSERLRFPVALALLAGAAAFPAGVLLQPMTHGALVASAVAVLGAVLVSVALAVISFGFLR